MRIPLDHAAFLTADTAATHRFYTQVMDWPLVGAWGRDDGDPQFFITAFNAGGWLIEFEEMVGVGKAPAPPAPGFPHFGLAAADRSELDAWKQRLDDHGIAYLETGEDLFFADPNGVHFQLMVRSWHGTPEEVLARSEEALARWLSRTAAPTPEG